MSRSIHSNRSRRQFRELGFRDWAEIAKKRDIKESALRDRWSETPPPSFVPAAAIPIRLIDQSPYLLFPASIDDMRAVLAALPPGSLDGLAGIRLEAGTRYINGLIKHYDIVDPYLGRKSVEEFPRIFTPAILGVYRLGSQTISLFGYAKGPKTVPTARQRVALELEALKTLVHELAHHYDRTRRLARGRPWKDLLRKGELFADGLTVEWTLGVVVPYLVQKHGSSATARLPRLVLHPRGTRRWRQRHWR
jgi:hypothetical protein